MMTKLPRWLAPRDRAVLHMEILRETPQSLTTACGSGSKAGVPVVQRLQQGGPVLVKVASRNETM